VGSLRPTHKSETRVDIALLASALFLQRFNLPFSGKFLALDFVFAALILVHQFASGRLVIRYDRLFWFLPAALAVTCSLLLNFNTTMLTSYSQFMVLFSLVTLSRPSTADRYKSTLRVFQLLVMLLSCLAVAQFVAQLVVDGRKLIMFYWVFPDFLLPQPEAFAPTVHSNMNTIIPIYAGSSLIKSNGIFLVEPSALSQVTAIGILIEVLEFRRPRYLLVIVLGFLMAYSGTGLMTLLLFLPFAGLRHSRAGLSALLVVTFALGLLATGIINLSIFLGRIGEFETNGGSGFGRFVVPLLLAAKHLDTAFLPALLVGSGPGTANNFTDTFYGGSSPCWFKLFYEYGVIGSFIFVCFFASCLRRSRCPGPALAALVFTFIFHGSLITSYLLTMIIVLCTLHDPEPRRGRIVDPRRYAPPLVVGSAIG